MFTVGIVTLSDKGAAGNREDLSGVKIKEMLPDDLYQVLSYRILPDEQKEIEQELTKKLIMKPEWYWKFNILSLMDWDIKTIADVFGGLSDKGFITGNEVRDRIGMSPLDGLDELRILENYIPMGMIGQQGKLIQDGGGDDA